MVKYLPAIQETRVQSLGQDDPLEKGVASHSSILAWRIPWAENSGGLQFMGSQTLRHDSATKQQQLLGTANNPFPQSQVIEILNS